MLPKILTGGLTPTKLDSFITSFEAYWHNLITLSFLKGKRVEVRGGFCWALAKRVCKIPSANSKFEISWNCISCCVLISFLLSYSKLFSGTFWICMMLGFSPVATTACLLILMLFMEFIMRVGVKSLYFPYLFILLAPDLILELRGITLSFYVPTPSRRIWAVLTYWLLAFYFWLMFCMLSFGAKTFLY